MRRYMLHGFISGANVNWHSRHLPNTIYLLIGFANLSEQHYGCHENKLIRVFRTYPCNVTIVLNKLLSD